MNPFEEVKKFCSELGVSISDVEVKLEEVGSDHSRCYFEDARLAGFYFAAVSLVLKGVENVLEVGVGRARTTNHLSRLFPDATIYGIDLPPSNSDYQNLASRRVVGSENAEMFKRNITMPNIVLIEQNSFFLPSLGLPEKFDLVFVDGDHCFPAVAWDTMWAYGHVREGGFLFMDDYQDSAVRTTMEYIKARISETIHLLPAQQKEESPVKFMWLRKGKMRK